MSTFLLLLSGFLLTWIVLKISVFPFALAALCWLLIFTGLTLTSKTTMLKGLWFNLAFVALLLGALEVYAYFSLKVQSENNSNQEWQYSKGYFVPDDVLGYVPKRSTESKATRTHNNRLIYNVTYTIGDDGLRITPEARSTDSRCILFFGGSFTFGEGLNDEETLPYILGKLQPLKVHNFGFHGYGPHQMLTAIERGKVDCDPRLVVYQTISAHVARSAGYSFWDTHGPKYELKNGSLVYLGNFDDETKQKSGKFLKNSNIFIKFWQNRYTIRDQDIQLFLQIVSASQRQLVKKHPGVEFQVVIWDHDPNDATLAKVKKGLQSLPLKVHLVSEILPGYSEDTNRYSIDVDDGHPSELANQLIAEYIVNKILPELVASP